jgi:LCP family protein required for cell wall assembly
MIPASEGQIINGTAVPTQVPYVPREGRNLVNIMLLGGDDELSQDGYGRTDTMIIVSINKDAGSVSMLSLPRDLFVYVPTTSGMMERLNIVYDFGEVNGYTGGGIGLLRQTILYNFGINVHYYARVNFSGFKEIIDAVGGVGIAVDCAYEDYQLLEAELPDGVIGDDEDGWVLPVGYYQMNGAQALWYVRSRHNSSDFDRGRRQQQLLRALWHQGRAELSITNAPNLWNQMMEVVDTNVPFQEFVSLVPLALNLDLDRIQSYTLTRTYHTIPWQPPNGSYVQLPVYDTVRPLLEDFYRPPPAARLAVAGSSIAVYNGTENANWDRVAAERLGWEGLAAYAAGSAETQDHAETVLIDYTGQQRGSSAPQIAAALNISSENIRFEPDPDRVADYAVILGSNYNSCDASVVPVDDI